MPKRLSKAYLDTMRERYKNAPKGLKTRILSEFCANSGYSRKHGCRILGGRAEPRRNRPGPKIKYGPDVVEHLRKLWQEMGYICSKKMRGALPLWLRYYGDASEEICKKLVTMSASTIDQKLNPYRGPKKKGLSTTRGLKSMMSRIPLKLLEGDVKEPGWVEADTVAHCGDNIEGRYVHTLTVTDLSCGWTENAAVWTKDAGLVLKQIAKIEARLPFKLKGFAADNGSEFMNFELSNYFFKRDEPIDFVRRRPYKKNDNAHVEQKNFTHVRELLGYERYDEFELVPLINEIYLFWNQLQNYFIPAMKLISKERVGSRVVKKYDQPKTPCQRLLDSDLVELKVKRQLRHNMQYKNPFHLKREVNLRLKILNQKLDDIKRRKQNTGS
jgi:hypothetical protein